jgi:lipoteichoic acid synthase
MNSDAVQTSDLLRFHDLENFTPIKPRDYSYKVNDTMDKLKTLEKTHDTVMKENKGKETSYTTDAPEIGGKPQTIKGE